MRCGVGLSSWRVESSRVEMVKNAAGQDPQGAMARPRAEGGCGLRDGSDGEYAVGRKACAHSFFTGQVLYDCGVPGWCFDLLFSQHAWAPHTPKLEAVHCPKHWSGQ